MRKITYYSLVAALVLLFAPHALAALNTISYTANYNSSPTIGTDTLGGVTYATVSYDGLYNGGDPGKPSLPIEYIRFSVPYNATNFTVSASPGRWVNHTLSNLIYPCQAPWIPDETGTPHPITLPDTASYYSGTTYPSQFAWVVDEGFLAGENHIVTVAVMPFSYTHTSTSDVVKKARYMNVWLDYTLSDTLSMYPIVRNDSALRQEGYELTQSMVVNPNQVTSFAPADLAISFDSIGGIIGPLNGGYGLNGGGGQVIPPGPPTPLDSLHQDTISVNPDLQYNDIIDGNNYTYLIITTTELEQSVRRLAALKRQKGFSVKIMTLDDIYTHPISQYGDSAINQNGVYTLVDPTSKGKIRKFLKYSYREHCTRYVLLVGRDVPYASIYYIPSDWYYSDLNSNLLTNEYYMDYPDYPDLYVGRILASSPSEIDNYTDKLLRYELNPGKGDYSYLKRAIFTDILEFSGCLDSVKNNLQQFFPEQTHISEIKGTKYPKGSDVVDSINANQYGFWGAFTHGAHNSIKTYGSTQNENSYYLYAIDNSTTGDPTGNGLNNFLNKDYPMVCYLPNCSTIQYDKPSLVFGESFTVGKDYGGPVYIGCTSGISEMSARILFELFTEKLSEGYYKLGVSDMLSKAFYNYTGDLKIHVLMKHNYLGDPVVELWTDIPQEYGNLTITRTNNSITVAGMDSGYNTITYICNNQMRHCKTSSSTVTFSGISPNGSLMVFRHNYIPYLAPMVLQNTNLQQSQYVITSDFSAGNNIDPNRNCGEVMVKSGVQYEIEASGDVRLEDGFKVEKGAEFAVYPSSF